MRRRIRKAEIKFLSLCPRGKNRMQVLYKADDDQVEFQCLVKDDDFAEKGELLACVYAPELRDSEGHIADTTVIKEMAYSHARNGAQLDIRHNGKVLAKEDAFVAENFLIQAGDPRFKGLKDRDGHSIDPTGGWGILVKIDNKDLREKYRSGEWNGVSLFGDGLLEIEKSELEGALGDLLEKLGGGESMKPEELKKALEESNKALATSIVEGIVAALQKSDKPTTPPKDDKKTDEPKELLFKGDPTDLDAIKKHAAALQKDALMKSIDWSDPEAVLAHVATLQKATDDAKDDDPSLSDVSTNETSEQRIARLEKENRTLRKATNQRTPDRSDAENEIPGLVESGLSKEDALLWQRGRALGQAINKRRGYSPN